MLQFDKDSDNSKIEVVQNVNKCPKLSHMDAESSHDRRRVILSRLGLGSKYFKHNSRVCRLWGRDKGI